MPKKPKTWQAVEWDSFKQSVKVGSKQYSPIEYLYTFYDDFGDCILIAELEDMALDYLNWRYLNGRGKWFSMGLFYNIPKCCIYGFAFDKPKNRHKLSNAYADHANKNGGDSWILCQTCAAYVEQYGIESYLINRAWEQAAAEPVLVEKE